MTKHINVNKTVERTLILSLFDIRIEIKIKASQPVLTSKPLEEKEGLDFGSKCLLNFCITPNALSSHDNLLYVSLYIVF